nr:polymer-forming cytoskeletal protein [Acetobacter estunensis]
MLFKRHKPDTSSTAAKGQATPSPKTDSVRPATSGKPEGASTTTPSSGHGSIFPSGRPAATPAGQAGTITPSKDSASMGRAPFPPTPGTPATGPTPTAAAPQGVMPGQRPSAVHAPRDDRRTLVVGRGISVQGSVQDAERLVVEGTVESSMINAKELSVAPGGLFRGGVEVEDAEIAGTVDGTLTVRGSLTVAATGRLLGKATCKRLRVEDGGQITGQLEMLSEAAKDSTSPSPKAD